jgi:hypothetical protein
VVDPLAVYQPPAAKRPPSKWWYVIGGVLAAIGLVGGITLFVVSLIQLTNRAPAADHAFANNASTTVHIESGQAQAIYVTPTTAYGDINCTARDTQGQHKPDLIPYDSEFTLDEWRQVFTLTVPETGDYTVSCSGPSDARYGVAQDVSATQFAVPFIAAGGGVVVFGVGLLIIIITVVRHVSARPKRPPYPPQPYSYPPPQPPAG